ncbi:MAG TPA: hypothetical protein VL944_01520 [Candidatus Acidoferrum sp.]|nr:hypothetical protein [Candidatus Acidoferrum sp.]
MSIQTVVQFSTVAIFALTFVLSFFITREFYSKRSRSLMFWSLGLWMFALAALLEIVFAYGIYNQPLIKLYLFVVALVVEFLALGSANLLKSKAVIRYYYIFCLVTTAALGISLIPAAIGNILVTYVVYGALPLLITITSSAIALPAAGVLIAIAALSFSKTRNPKMLSIIAGVVIVSIGGLLYITVFPVFLYYSEFIGIVLLWLGFFDLKMLRLRS